MCDDVTPKIEISRKPGLAIEPAGERLHDLFVRVRNAALKLVGQRLVDQAIHGLADPVSHDRRLDDVGTDMAQHPDHIVIGIPALTGAQRSGHRRPDSARKTKAEPERQRPQHVSDAPDVVWEAACDVVHESLRRVGWHRLEPRARSCLKAACDEAGVKEAPMGRVRHALAGLRDPTPVATLVLWSGAQAPLDIPGDVGLGFWLVLQVEDVGIRPESPDQPAVSSFTVRDHPSTKAAARAHEQTHMRHVGEPANELVGNPVCLAAARLVQRVDHHGPGLVQLCDGGHHIRDARLIDHRPIQPGSPAKGRSHLEDALAFGMDGDIERILRRDRISRPDTAFGFHLRPYAGHG